MQWYLRISSMRDPRGKNASAYRDFFLSPRFCLNNLLLTTGNKFHTFQIGLSLSYFLHHQAEFWIRWDWRYPYIILSISERKKRHTKHAKTHICFLITHLRAQKESEQAIDTNWLAKQLSWMWIRAFYPIVKGTHLKQHSVIFFVSKSIKILIKEDALMVKG